jgi:hypothetical protein
MERFLQEGQETCRHISQIFVEYDAGLRGSTCRWPYRRVLEEQQTWSAARARWGVLYFVHANQQSGHAVTLHWCYNDGNAGFVG